MNHYTYLVDVLVTALDRMGVRAIGARPLLLTASTSEDAALSFHLLQAFPMANVVEKGSDIYSKLSDASGEAWKGADGFISLSGVVPTAAQLVAATRYATGCFAILVKDESVSSLFPLFNQTPMRRVCVNTGTGFSMLIASKRVVYAMDPTAFVQLTPMDAQLWALSPEEWRSSFAMRMQHALLPAYAAFAAAAAAPNAVPFLPHPQAQYMPPSVSQPSIFFPQPPALNPMFSMAAANVGGGTATPNFTSAMSPAPGHLTLPPMSSSLPHSSNPRIPSDSIAMPPLDAIHIASSMHSTLSGAPPTLRPSSVSSLVSHSETASTGSVISTDDSFAAGALASIVKRGSQDESDSDPTGSPCDNDSDGDNHNSLLFLKGAHAANQGRHLEGAIRKFKNQFSKKDVITRVCKMKYRSAQRKLRIAKYIEIWPEIATMSQRAAERYISQNLKKRVDVAATVGDE